MPELLSWTRYGVRASGLALVVLLAAILGVTAVASKQRAILSAVACGWVTAAAVLSWPRLPNSWRRDPPSDKQLEYAGSLGIQFPPGISKGDLSDMISAAVER